MGRGFFDDNDVVVEGKDGKLVDRKVSFLQLQSELGENAVLDRTRDSKFYGASLDALRRQTHGYQESENARLADGTLVRKQSVVDYQRNFAESFKQPMNLNSPAAMAKLQALRDEQNYNYQYQQGAFVNEELDESGVPVRYNEHRPDVIDNRNYSYEEIKQRSESQFGPIRVNNDDNVRDVDDYLDSIKKGTNTGLGLEMDSEVEVEENNKKETNDDKQTENVVDIISKTEKEIENNINEEKIDMNLNEFLENEERKSEVMATEVNNVTEPISLEEAIGEKNVIYEEYSDTIEVNDKVEELYDSFDDIPEELLDKEKYDVENVEILAYTLRDFHDDEPSSKVQKLFKSIIAMPAVNSKEKLYNHWLNNEEVAIEIPENSLDKHDNAVIGELSCPICGTKYPNSNYMLTDLFSGSPDNTELIQEFLFKSSVENQKKGIQDRRFTYVHCDNCIDQIREDFDKYGLPMQNKNLDNLYSVFGKLVGLSIYRELDANHNIKHLFPTQRIFLIHNKTKQIYYYNLFELIAIINFQWNNYCKSAGKKYSDKELTDAYNSLMLKESNPIKTEFLGEEGFLYKWFSEYTHNQDWVTQDLLKRFNIKLAQDFMVSRKLTCNVGVQGCEEYTLSLDKDKFQGLRTIMSIIPLITKDPNKCVLLKQETKQSTESVEQKQEIKKEINVPDNIIEGEMDLSELETKQEEVIDDEELLLEEEVEEIEELPEEIEPEITQPPVKEESKAETPKEPTVVETIKKPEIKDLHWSQLSNIDFLQRYKPTQEEVKFYVGKLQNDKSYNKTDSKEIVNDAILEWIKEKKKQLEFAENKNSEDVKKNLTDSLNKRTDESLKYKERINKDYIDNTAFNRFKPEETEDSKMVKDRMKRDAARRNSGPHPELLFADNDKYDKNPFDDNKSLLMDFHKTHMSKVLQIMKQDTEKHKANGRVVDFPKTSYIPTIDFDTGIRVMYVDLEDTSLNPGNANVADISLHTPFTYSDYRDNFQTVFVYSPEARRKPYQVANALVKLINYRSYPAYRKVDLSRNFVLAYTDEKNEIDKFEFKHSVASWGNAKTDQLAVLALINPDKLRSVKYEKLRIADEIRKIYNGNLEGNFSNLKNHKLEMVCSIRYIAQEFRDKESGMVYWQYRITQYDEHSTCMLDDGFTCACSALIREHYLKRGPVPYKILFEFDRTLMITPMLRRKTEDLLNGPFELAPESRNCQFNSTREAFMIMDPLMQGVTPEDEKFKCRIDSRLFLINERSFRSFFGNRIPYDKDVSTEQLRLKEMEKLGFNLYYEPYAPTLEIKVDVLNELEQHPAFQRMNKINIAQLRNSNAYTSLELQAQLEFQAYLLEMNNTPQEENDDNDSFSTLKKWATVGLGTLFGNGW